MEGDKNKSLASPAPSSPSKVAEDFICFVNGTGSPYHSVVMVERMLREAGGTELKEEDQRWSFERKKIYFVKRNDSSIMAFRAGQKAQPISGNCSFKIIAAHTDSPCLRVRPRSKLCKEGVCQVGIETYGGGLWHTWFDRGLGFAGKVVTREESPDGGPGTTVERLVRVDEPILIIPNLAIHLQSADERGAFKINKETHLQPVIALDEKGKEKEEKACNSGDKKADGDISNGGIDSERFCPYLLDMVAEAAKVPKETITDVDLCLMDATLGKRLAKWMNQVYAILYKPSRFAGAKKDFIESPRLDNQVSTWAAFKALVERTKGGMTAKDGKVVADDENNESCGEVDETSIDVAVAFDHEEIGSESWTGADSNSLEIWLNRILSGLELNDDFQTASADASTTATSSLHSSTVFYPSVMARSFLISSDMAHAVHPNYPEKHQSQHKPLINKGIVLKENCNFRYTSQAASMSAMRNLAIHSNLPIQDFVVRNDSPCGSTVGPMLSSRLGIRGIDLGIPQWAMHSCREICGARDLSTIAKFFQRFFLHSIKIVSHI